MKKTKWALVIAATLWVGLTSLFISTPTNTINSAPKEGFAAPDFELSTLTGDSIRLENLRGKVVVINFWTSWCPPCKAEMPALQRIHDRYLGEDVYVLAINVTNQDSLENLRKFTTELDISLTIPLDTDGSTSAAYRVQAFPSTYFIDQEGVIRKIIIGGPMSEAVIDSAISNLFP